MNGLVWGDVATWFTGLLTAGSLLVGFSIVRSDRRKEAERQVSQVGCWTTVRPNYKAVKTIYDEYVYPGYHPSAYELNAHNASESVIVNPSLVAVPLSPRAIALLGDGAKLRTLAFCKAPVIDKTLIFVKGRLLKHLRAYPRDENYEYITDSRVDSRDRLFIRLDVGAPVAWYSFYFDFNDAYGAAWRIRLRDHKLLQRSTHDRRGLKQWLLENL